MAVALDANAVTAFNISATTSATNTTLTVGAGATALLGFLIQETACTAQTMHWDSTGTNQAMTLIGSSVGANGWIYLFGLVNPTTGNHTLSSSWTTSCFQGVLSACSFTGTATTFAAAFANFLGNATTGTTTTLVLTGATGNISVCAGANNQHAFSSFSATGSTVLFNVTGVDGEAAYAPSSASTTWTIVTSASSTITMAGVDVVAAPPSQVPYQPWYQRAPILAR
jgi:hypothetical protein